jgi:hypothetical protein
LNIPSAALPALALPRQHLQRWLSLAISLALLGAILLRLGDFGSDRLLEMLPRSPFFWVALAAYYLALPLSEWLIYWRLWRLPSSGFAALLRKLVSNEVLFGYSGELSFYAWARRHVGLTSAPFGAVKDVSITSAFAGNLATLTMLAIAWPFMHLIDSAIGTRVLALSGTVILVTSALAGLFNRRLLSLPRREIAIMISIHLGRLAVTTILSGVIWHSAMPESPLPLWIALAALQLLVTRLPFVPNKDLLFANIALLVMGSASAVGGLMALVASLILITHLMVGGVLAIAELLTDLAEEAGA